MKVLKTIKHRGNDQLYSLVVIPHVSNAPACAGCAFRIPGSRKCTEGRANLSNDCTDVGKYHKYFPVWQPTQMELL